LLNGLFESDGEFDPTMQFNRELGLIDEISNEIQSARWVSDHVNNHTKTGKIVSFGNLIDFDQIDVKKREKIITNLAALNNLNMNNNKSLALSEIMPPYLIKMSTEPVKKAHKHRQIAHNDYDDDYYDGYDHDELNAQLEDEITNHNVELPDVTKTFTDMGRISHCLKKALDPPLSLTLLPKLSQIFQLCFWNQDDDLVNDADTDALPEIDIKAALGIASQEQEYSPSPNTKPSAKLLHPALPFKLKNPKAVTTVPNAYGRFDNIVNHNYVAELTKQRQNIAVLASQTFFQIPLSKSRNFDQVLPNLFEDIVTPVKCSVTKTDNCAPPSNALTSLISPTQFSICYFHNYKMITLLNSVLFFAQKDRVYSELNHLDTVKNTTKAVTPPIANPIPTRFSLIPDLLPCQMDHIRAVLHQFRYQKYANYFNVLVELKVKNRFNNLVRIHIDELLRSDTLDEFKTLLKDGITRVDGIGDSNTGDNDDDGSKKNNNMLTFKFENQNCPYFVELLNALAGDYNPEFKDKPINVVKNNNKQSKRKNGKSKNTNFSPCDKKSFFHTINRALQSKNNDSLPFSDMFHNNDSDTPSSQFYFPKPLRSAEIPFQCEKLTIILLGRDYTPLFNNYVKNFGHHNDQNDDQNEQYRKDKSSYISALQSSHHDLPPVWNNGNVVFTFMDNRPHQGDDGDDENNRDIFKTSHIIPHLSHHRLSHCFYDKNQRNLLIIMKKVLESRRQNENWAYRKTNLPNRHSHCVDKPSYYAYGYATFDEYAHSVSRDQLQRYLDLHRDCCGLISWHNGRKDTEGSKIEHTDQNNEQDSDPPRGRKRQRIQHWIGQPWDQYRR